jgi:hypothetical protein
MKAFFPEVRFFFLIAVLTALAVVGIVAAQARGGCIQNCYQDDRGSWICRNICS